jgi:hypothetical protein
MYENSPAQQKNGLVPGIVAGFVAAVVGAALYALFVDLSGYEFGAATIGIGALVGLAMMAVKPTSPVLPVIAAIFSFAGAALGIVVEDVVVLVRTAESLGTPIGYGEAFTIVTDHFSELVDIKSILIWAIGAAFGFTFVNRRVMAAQRSATTAPSAPVTIPEADGPQAAPQTAGTTDAAQGESKEAEVTEAEVTEPEKAGTTKAEAAEGDAPESEPEKVRS